MFKIILPYKFFLQPYLPELFTEQNLVLHVFWKFQVISLIISWNITSLCHLTGKFCWMKYHLFAIKLVTVVLITWNFASRLGFIVRNNLTIFFWFVSSSSRQDAIMTSFYRQMPSFFKNVRRRQLLLNLYLFLCNLAIAFSIAANLEW